MIRVLKIIVITILASCSNYQECNDIELKIKEICVDTDTVYEISLITLTNFEWDTLYVIVGPTIDDEVEQFIKIRYEKVIKDNRRQYIFVKGNEIVKEYSSNCNLNLSKHPNYEIGQKYSNRSLMNVEKKEGENQFIYRVDQIQY